jgi:hypothetical protein
MRLSLIRELRDLLAHSSKLIFQITNFFIAHGIVWRLRRWLRRSSSTRIWRRSCATKGCEHAHRLFEYLQILPSHILEILNAYIFDIKAPAKSICEFLAHAFLVAGEILHRHFEIARQIGLERVSIKSDELAQKLDGQKMLPFVFLVEDDLRQNRAGDVFAAARIAHFEIYSVPDHLREMFQRDIARTLGVVEPTVGVFLDDGWVGRPGIIVTQGFTL